jgi:putative ABC transport system permease protein
MWGFAWQNLVTRPARTALAAVGLTIPVLASFGLFSISRGIPDPVGGTIAPPEQETWQVPSRRRP